MAVNQLAGGVLDRESAMTAHYFHHGADCAQTVTYGPRGGAQYPRTELWRRNGATQTWRTRPDEYRVPIKYGLRAYGSLTQHDGAPYGAWHVGTAEDCALGTLAASLAAALDRSAQ
jgi:hypothetical protein